MVRWLRLPHADQLSKVGRAAVPHAKLYKVGRAASPHAELYEVPRNCGRNSGPPYVACVRHTPYRVRYNVAAVTSWSPSFFAFPRVAHPA